MKTAVVVNCQNPEYQVAKGTIVVAVDPRYFRPTEVDLLIGNPEKAKKQLNWTLEYDLPALVSDMVKSDIELFKRDQYLQKGGHGYNELP